MTAGGSGADVDELPTNVLDPLRPRPIDRPTALPAGGVIDPEVGDIAKVFAAPDDPADRPAWRADLAAWRAAARERLGYRGDRYERAETEWTQGAFAVAQIWLWDDRLFDHEAGVFTPDRLLAFYADSGGLDGLVLWHAYPIIGIDDRNQFDFYRQVPGLWDLVDALHDRGVRVFVDYNPWDVGTRRTGRPDAEELAALVTELGADGVFLDTLKQADEGLVVALESATPPQALEGESRVALEHIGTHLLSWAQWFADSPVPGVLRARWFERRHMMHATRRWNRDHAEELQSAWLNGTGMLVWDAVFGVWVGWNPRDRATLARMLAVQRPAREILVAGEWEPLTELAPEATAAGVHASLYSLRGVRLWTVVNRGESDYDGPVVPSVEERTLVPARGIAVVVDAEPDADPALAAALIAAAGASRAIAAGSDHAFPARPAMRVPAPETTTEPPDDAIRIEPGAHELPRTFRRRETGIDDTAPYVEEWKPLPPRLHDERHDEVVAEVGRVAVATREVTAGELATFRGVEASDPAAPATLVGLAEARAFAAAQGARLATEHEWQLAAADPRFARSTPAVWNWTESEHRDGITRYVILKGGADHTSEGSDWYFDGGVREPAFAAKMLLAGLGVDASPSIGFRLAWDLP